MASPDSSQSSRSGEDDDIDHARSRKRARLSRSLSNDSIHSDDPVLPDSFRRSPEVRRPYFQPGSIVRITLTNFVTYTNAEFHPGPNLNMVIGPNGTGKSTLVCAICLGLGWGTQHLGRAKNIGEFIKHGSKTAMIEIELARDPDRQTQNPVITSKISNSGKPSGGKVEFLVDGKEVSKAAVQRLARSFSIQVDNLCQFLPQDRVVEFASLSPVDLLAATQKATASDQVCEWHDTLKSLSKSLDSKQGDRATLEESVKRLEQRQRAQQVDVDRIREHAVHQQKLKYLELAKPFPLYKDAHAEHNAAKERRNESRRALAMLQEQLEPNLRALNEQQEYLKEIETAREAKKRLVDRTGMETAKKNNEYEARGREIALEQKQHKMDVENVKKAYTNVKKLNHNIEKLEQDLKQAPPVVDFTQMNSDVRAWTREVRTLEDSRRQAQDSLQTLRQQFEHRTKAIHDREQRKVRLQSQLGRQVSKVERISKHSAMALAWLESNKSFFEDEIHLPPLINCTVKDKRAAALVEQVLGRGAIMIMATSDRDFKTLQHKLLDKKEQNLSDVLLRQIPAGGLSDTRVCSNEELAGLGFDGWLIDLIDGPPEVLAAICDNYGLDSVAYSWRPFTIQQNERVKASPISSWITPKEHSTILRRREYGAGAEAIRVNQVAQPTMFTDSPVSTEAETNLDGAIRELKDEIHTIQNEIDLVKAKLGEIQGQINAFKQQIDAKTREKNELQEARSAFEGIPVRLDKFRTELSEEQRKVDEFSSIRAEHENGLDRMFLEKAQMAVDLSRSADQFHNLHMELLTIELMEIEARSDSQQLAARSEEDQRLLRHHQAEVVKLAAAVTELKDKAGELRAQCLASNNQVPEEDEAAYSEMCKLSTDDLEGEIASTAARLELVGGGNANIIKEFEGRAKEIEKKQAALRNFDEELAETTTQIASIRSQWEPVLDDIVSRISERFAENFAQIECAGEVELHKNDEDYSQWAIHIKVKFREEEPMSVLNNQRQSGGERAVSTIFYLMAMQSLARAPFRVVDEINQGMDPRNERMVHSRLVSIACDSARDDGAGGSQYFLITPKLLTGLKYHANMKVHCIASGEYMPKGASLDALDFGKLAQKALTVRAARG